MNTSERGLEVIRSGVSLTVHDHRGRPVTGSGHVAGHAGVLPSILKPNSLDVEAAIAAHSDIWILDQLKVNKGHSRLQRLDFKPKLNFFFQLDY